MVSYNEVFQLLLAIVMAPLISRTMRGHKMATRRLLSAALACILASYVFTIAEGFAAEALFNDLEHFFIAAAGVLFAAGAFSAMRYLESRGGGGSS